MKARVKATGEIIEVKPTLIGGNYIWVGVDGCFHTNKSLDFLIFTEESSDVKEKSFPKDEPDYWDKLHHQAAIATMQGILSNDNLWCSIIHGVYPPERPKYLAKEVNKYAAELVNKLKEDKS